MVQNFAETPLDPPEEIHNFLFCRMLAIQATPPTKRLLHLQSHSQKSMSNEAKYMYQIAITVTESLL